MVAGSPLISPEGPRDRLGAPDDQPVLDVRARDRAQGRRHPLRCQEGLEVGHTLEIGRLVLGDRPDARRWRRKRATLTATSLACSMAAPPVAQWIRATDFGVADPQRRALPSADASESRRVIRCRSPPPTSHRQSRRTAPSADARRRDSPYAHVAETEKRFVTASASCRPMRKGPRRSPGLVVNAAVNPAGPRRSPGRGGTPPYGYANGHGPLE